MTWGSIGGAAVTVLGGALMGGGGNSGGGSGGGGGGSSGPPTYVPKNQAGMDDNFNKNYNNYQVLNDSTYGQMQPYMQQNFQNAYNNPQAQGFMQGAQNAGSQYGALSGQMGQLGQNMYGAGNQAYNTGFDPRGAIYNQNRNDLTENVRAGEYARGISMSPDGASVEADSLGRFQNQWQNEQQGRQLAGLQGMGRAYGQGSEMQGQGAQYAGMAGSVPYNAQNQVFQNQRGAINDLYSAQQPYMQGLQQQQNNIQSYNNYGQSAQNQAFNQNRSNNQDQNQMYQQLAPLGGKIASGIGNWWNSQPGNGTPNGYSSENQFSGGNDGWSNFNGESLGT